MSTSRALRRLHSLGTSSPDLLRCLYDLIQSDDEEQYLSSLRGSELTRLVDFLDRALDVTPITDDVSRRCLHKLQALCSHHKILPSLYYISGDLTKVDSVPVASGGFSDIWEGIKDGNRVCIKCLRLTHQNRQVMEKVFYREAVMWKRLKHPNIVGFIGVTQNPLQFVSEWMPNGTLTEYLDGNPDANRIGLLLDVAEGLTFLHANNATHGDLKGPNILIDHSGRARLADFGFTSVVRGMDSVLVTAVQGYSARWAAPEVLGDGDRNTREADIFSFGMIVIEAFTGKHPFSGFSTLATISKIIGGERPVRPQEPGLTDTVWDTTLRCWNEDPAQRPTMTRVVGILRECSRIYNANPSLSPLAPLPPETLASLPESEIERQTSVRTVIAKEQQDINDLNFIEEVLIHPLRNADPPVIQGGIDGFIDVPPPQASAMNSPQNEFPNENVTLATPQKALHIHPRMTTNYPFKNTFLTELASINTRSREFPDALARLLGSQENVNTALSLQGEDALTLVDILDQVFEVPNMSLDLRRRSVRILRSVCGLQTILPHSCILSENISKEGDTAFVSGRFADTWKGRHNGNPVCIKAFPTYTTDNLTKIKERLFQEIIIWRRLSHPNVLPVLGVSPRLFPLCIVSEWMIDGNILDITSSHPEVNRLRLLAEAASGLQYLHSLDIIHGGLKPTNIVVDGNFHARLTDYRLAAIISDTNPVELDGKASFPVGTARHMAPELLDPFGFNLKDSNPTMKSDIYAFGVVTYHVTTGERPFPGARDGVVIYSVVMGERPSRPLNTNEWVSDDVWNLISRCWSPSWDGRPDVDFAINALNDAADAVEARHRKSYMTNDQDTSPSVSARLSSRGASRRRTDGASIHEVLQHSPPPPETPAAPSPFIVKRFAYRKGQQKERKKQQARNFRTWRDSTDIHWQHAALVNYRSGVVHLSSSDGTLLEIAEERLSQDDLNYLNAQDVYIKAQRKNGRQGSEDSSGTSFLRGAHRSNPKKLDCTHSEAALRHTSLVRRVTGRPYQ